MSEVHEDGVEVGKEKVDEEEVDGVGD